MLIIVIDLMHFISDVRGGLIGERVKPGYQCFLLGIFGIFQTAAFDYSQQELPQCCTR